MPRQKNYLFPLSRLQLQNVFLAVATHQRGWSREKLPIQKTMKEILL
jgi:hypothetical protein